MDAVNVQQATDNFAELISRVELGEEVVISNQNRPVAKLVPFQAVVDKRLDRHASLGYDRGLFTVPDDFNAPLPEDILASFEGDIA